MKPAPAFLTPEQAAYVLRLWATCAFDTMEIAELVDAREAAVARIIQAARDLARLWRVEH